MQFNGCTLPDDYKSTIGGQGGLRFGTNIITARGYTPDDCRQVATYLNELAHVGQKVESSEAAVWSESLKVNELAEEIECFATKFPMPGFNSKHIF